MAENSGLATWCPGCECVDPCIHTTHGFMVSNGDTFTNRIFWGIFKYRIYLNTFFWNSWKKNQGAWLILFMLCAPMNFETFISSRYMDRQIFHSVLDLPFMLDLLLFMPQQIFILLTPNKSSPTSVHSFYCVSWVLVMFMKGIRLRSFTMNEKLKIVKEAEETSNRFAAHLVRYFLFVYFLCWFWECVAYSRAQGIRVNTVM